MTIRRFWQYALWCALLPASLLAGCRVIEPPTYERLTFAPSVKTKKVLFIGNSLTFYNDLPGLIQRLAAREPEPLEIDSVTLANATLADHWNLTAARKHVQRGGWDYVVLQEYSSRPADKPEATLSDYRMWSTEVAKVRATPIIFENWAYVQHPDDLQKMRTTYDRVQREIGGEIAPIGSAWHRIRSRYPEVDLFVDEKHPTIAGTYLAACILYKTIYHKPATGLPTTIPGMKLDPQVAALLQRVADERSTR